MTEARIDYQGGEYVDAELIRYDLANSDEPGHPPGNTWVLQQEDGNVIALDADKGHARVEIKCDVCGAWGDHAGPIPDSHDWRCFGGTGPCDQT